MTGIPRPGYQELSVVVADVTAVGEHHRGDLGQVHARPAADPPHDGLDRVAAEPLGDVDDVAARQIRFVPSYTDTETPCRTSVSTTAPNSALVAILRR